MPESCHHNSELVKNTPGAGVVDRHGQLHWLDRNRDNNPDGDGATSIDLIQAEL